MADFLLKDLAVQTALMPDDLLHVRVKQRGVMVADEDMQISYRDFLKGINISGYVLKSGDNLSGDFKLTSNARILDQNSQTIIRYAGGKTVIGSQAGSIRFESNQTMTISRNNTEYNLYSEYNRPKPGDLGAGLNAPDSAYTRADVDSLLTKYYDKTQVDAKVTTLNASIATKVDTLTYQTQVAPLIAAMTRVVTLDTPQQITGAKAFTDTLLTSDVILSPGKSIFADSGELYVSEPFADAHAANKKYVDDLISTYVPTLPANVAYKDSGNTFTATNTFQRGFIVTGGNVDMTRVTLTVQQTTDTSAANVPATKSWVEGKIAAGGWGGNTPPANMLDTNTAQSVSGVKTFSALPLLVGAPTQGNQAANKAYVDANSLSFYKPAAYAADLNTYHAPGYYNFIFDASGTLNAPANLAGRFDFYVTGDDWNIRQELISDGAIYTRKATNVSGWTFTPWLNVKGSADDVVLTDSSTQEIQGRKYFKNIRLNNVLFDTGATIDMTAANLYVANNPQNAYSAVNKKYVDDAMSTAGGNPYEVTQQSANNLNTYTTPGLYRLSLSLTTGNTPPGYNWNNIPTELTVRGNGTSVWQEFFALGILFNRAANYSGSSWSFGSWYQVGAQEGMPLFTNAGGAYIKVIQDWPSYGVREVTAQRKNENFPITKGDKSTIIIDTGYYPPDSSAIITSVVATAGAVSCTATVDNIGTGSIAVTVRNTDTVDIPQNGVTVTVKYLYTYTN